MYGFRRALLYFTLSRIYISCEDDNGRRSSCPTPPPAAYITIPTLCTRINCTRFTVDDDKLRRFVNAYQPDDPATVCVYKISPFLPPWL